MQEEKIQDINTVIILEKERRGSNMLRWIAAPDMQWKIERILVVEATNEVSTTGGGMHRRHESRTCGMSYTHKRHNVKNMAIGHICVTFNLRGGGGGGGGSRDPRPRGGGAAAVASTRISKRGGGAAHYSTAERRKQDSKARVVCACVCEDI